MLLNKFGEHVAVGDNDLGMVPFELSEMLVVWPKDKVDQPLGRGGIVHRAGIACLKKPTILRSDGDTAKSAGMTEEGNEVHFRLERETDGIEIIPFRIDCLIENEFRPMRDIARIISRIGPPKLFSIGEGIVFAAMDMDFGMWKIGQAADMVEVHVSENDVPDIFGVVSQFFDAIDRSFVHIE